MEPIKQAQEPKKRTHVAVHHHHVSLTLMIIIALLVVVIIISKHAFIGYRLEKQFEKVGMKVESVIFEMDSLKSEILFTETRLESCKLLNNESFETIKTEKNNLFICE
ncbi:MAG: hypothetical protein AABW92_05240 [Nanoarchaeota archaeon]